MVKMPLYRVTLRCVSVRGLRETGKGGKGGREKVEMVGTDWLVAWGEVQGTASTRRIDERRRRGCVLRNCIVLSSGLKDKVEMLL